MAVLPGSLDYLYYNGILPTIPYKAYEQTPVTASGMAQMSGMGTGYNIGNSIGMTSTMNSSQTMPQMNGTQYLQSAQKGLLYDTYNYPDTFVPKDNGGNKPQNEYSIAEKAYSDGENYGVDADYEVMANGEEGKRIRKSIANTCSKAANSVIESPIWVKGILAGGIVAFTLCSLFKGKKVPKQVQKTSFFSKLNPLKWLKK